MNFLSHFYMDMDSKNPEYVMGLVFPDLLRNSKQGLRIKKTKLHEIPPTDVQHFILGVKKHYLVDQIFHNSAYFKENTGFIQQELKNRNFTHIKSRYFFFSSYHARVNT